MFEKPFSFNGRIRRMEYALSIFLYFFANYAVMFFTIGTEYYTYIFWSMFVVTSWFIIAQGAKRCHDVGTNGFYQFIPFYFIWLIVEDGQPKTNTYGPNPKGLKSPEETGKIRKNEG